MGTKKSIGKMKKDNEVVKRTLERRTVLEWLGKAAVLGLSSPLLQSCEDGLAQGGSVVHVPPETAMDTDSRSDFKDTTSETITGQDTETALVDTDSTTEQNDDFVPGEGHPLLDQFVVFTVDEQNLATVLSSWRLLVDGLVENPITLTFGDLRRMTPVNQVTDFHCVTGWSVYDVPWVGVSLSELLDRVGPKSNATHVIYHCNGDIYTESTTIEEAREDRTIMAYGVGDSTLPLDHGFPLRLVIPRKYGYKNAKYIYRIELTDNPHSGYWVARGYPYDADVSEERLRDGKY